jgi:hypothetical protein
MRQPRKNLGWMIGKGMIGKGMLALLAAAVLSTALGQRATAQDRSDRPQQDRPDRPQQDQRDQEDPPSRVARLAYMQGSVSFQPAGESQWVEAAPNRPMTTGDQLWADKDSRAELSLGSAVIDLNSSTGVSFLNLDDRTVQLQLSAGAINVRVRHLDRDDVFEIDTPNQAFSIYQPGRYRVEASEDGRYTVVSIREGEGESTGNGQTYTLHRGQRATFEGSDRLNAQVEDIGDPDDFDNWASSRDRRYEDSPSARYVSHDVVGYEDLDENGDWQPDAGYGNVWYPHVSPGWAPYRQGHWAWIDPWGWTWVDDEPWGYAPFHYGRWLSIGGRWGWVPGPPEVRPVYAPALVVFVGGGGANMGWFPLGPREVYVPSYPVSRGYVNRVNVSNTNVNVTQVTNVYNTTVINKTTNITNVTYVNKNVSGAVTAVPQNAFASGQPVSRVAVPVNAREIASAPVNARAAVAPTSNSVLGVHANTANRVAAPPAAVVSRPIVAKTQAPPPPVPFAARQQALAAHPGQPIARQEMQRLQAANTAPAALARPPVKQAPPGKPATPTMGRPGTQPPNAPANQPANRPGNPPPANNAQPNRPGASNPPAANPAQPNRPFSPPSAQPNNRPEANQPPPNNRPAEPPARNDRPSSAQPNNHPEANQPPPNNRPAEPPARNDRPSSAQPNNRPEANQPPPNNRPAEPPARNDRPPSAQPNNRPEANQPPPNNRPAEPPARNDRPSAQPNNHPDQNRPEQARPAEPPQRNQPADRPSSPPPSERQQSAPPQQAHPAPPPQRQPPPPDQKKKQDEKPHN